MTTDYSQFEDALVAAPKQHTVIFENNSVRMIKVVFQPGDVAAMHRHPTTVNYILASGTLRLTLPDGSASDVDLTVGQVLPGDACAHAVENIGSTEFQTLEVEFK
jgi:quercetin dioxygenase-like cupin family protein